MLGLPSDLPRPGGLVTGFASDAVTAAVNLFDATVRGGLADTRRMPSALIDEGPLRRVHRYLPLGRGGRRSASLPVLLVPPLAAPAICFDLRRGCSLAEHLLRRGHETYLLDYGPVRFSDRSLGLEHWIEDVLPNAVRAVSEDAGGRPVQLVGWCLGGILALLAQCVETKLPVASTAMVASPFDFARVPLVAPLRPIAAVTQGQLVTQLYRLLGGAPAPLVKRGYQLAGFDKYVMKPWTIARGLHDRELLAQIEAVDVFMDNMHAYPGRTFGQLYHRFFRSNDLANGRLALSDRTLDLADVARPGAVDRGPRRRDRARGGLPSRRRAAPAARPPCSSRPRPAVISACSPAAPRAGRRGCCSTASWPSTRRLPAARRARRSRGAGLRVAAALAPRCAGPAATLVPMRRALTILCLDLRAERPRRVGRVRAGAGRGAAHPHRRHGLRRRRRQPHGRRGAGQAASRRSAPCCPRTSS